MSPLQRGTGLSTPLTASALSQLSGPQEQAALLALFRADSIVRDAELFRKTLLPPGEKWTLLGQVRVVWKTSQLSSF